MSRFSFTKANILEDWTFATGGFDLVTFSLVLEHIENLAPVLQKAAEVLQPNGCLYISELHPFKQYSGSKARFETATGTQVAPCFNHHFSDFTAPLLSAGLQLEKATENFDADDRNNLPRLLTLLFRKQ